MNVLSRSLLSLTLLALAAGCSDNPREEATGDARIVGLNTIVESPDVTFLIEERSLGPISYGGTTLATRWDDLSYNFNFDTAVPGEGSARRLATRFLDVTRDRSYLFVLTGTIANPDIVLFDDEERQWEGTETVLEMTFAHFNNTAGSVDMYFHAAGTNPVAGNQAATLSFGERSAPIEFAEGNYVVSVTPANDDQTILFQSGERQYIGATTDTIALLDADPSRTAPLVVRHLRSDGGSDELSDPRFPPAARFLHAIVDVGPLDVYEGNDFSAPLVGNQAFGDFSGDVTVTAGGTDYDWTDAGNSGAVVLESTQTISAGRYTTIALVGPSSDPDVLNIPNVRRPYSTSGRISFINAADSQDALDVYLLPAGETVADNDPIARNFPFRNFIGQSPVATDSYELYATPFNDKTVLAGPVAVDIGPRDVYDVLVLDTADPNALELRVIRNAP